MQFDEIYKMLEEKFNQEVSIEYLLEDLHEERRRPKPRYDGNNLRDIRPNRNGDRTRNRSIPIYKRRADRGMNANDNASVRNTTNKLNNRIGISKGLGGTLKLNADGKRTPKKVGKRINSKLPYVVSHIKPNGDIVVGREVKTPFAMHKIKSRLKKIEPVLADT